MVNLPRAEIWVGSVVDMKSLKKSSILEVICRVGQKKTVEVYLVGGAVRDVLLGRVLGRDFDFVVKGDAGSLARDIAAETAGHAFLLDAAFGTWRVVVKKRKGRAELDFSSLQGRNILEDLRQRDFSVNSMAMNLKDIQGTGDPPLIDPLGGAADLKKRIVRANSEESIRRDPLRMLRAFRFSATLGFSIEESTLAMVQANKSLILHSSGERVRSELFMALNADGAASFLREMGACGLLEEIFPETGSWNRIMAGKQISLMDHALKTVAAGEHILIHIVEIYPTYGRALVQHFSQSLEEGVSRKALFKFAGFFHDSGKPNTMTWVGELATPRFLDHDLAGGKINTEIGRKLRLSRNSIRILTELTRQHMRVASLSQAKEVTGRAKYRFFADLKREGIDLALLSLADIIGSTGVDIHRISGSDLPPGVLRIRDTVRELLGYYFDEHTRRRQQPLLDGREVMELLGIPQGKRLGELLQTLREAEASGGVQTRGEALKFLKNIDKSG